MTPPPLERVGGFLVLTERRTDALEGEMADAEARLSVRLPAGYRECLARFGRGTFGEHRWLLRPSLLQSYGSLFDEGTIAGPTAELVVFAAADDAFETLAELGWTWPRPSRVGTLVGAQNRAALRGTNSRAASA